MLHRTSLAHAERSAYNRPSRRTASISWDSDLSTWTLSGDFGSRRRVDRLGGAIGAVAGVLTGGLISALTGALTGGVLLGRTAAVDVHAGLPGVRGRVPDADHHEVRQRTDEQDDRHPLPPPEPEDVVELDGVDPQVLDPAPAQAVGHHVDREAPAEAEPEPPV